MIITVQTQKRKYDVEIAPGLKRQYERMSPEALRWWLDVIEPVIFDGHAEIEKQFQRIAKAEAEVGLIRDLLNEDE